MRRLGKLRNEQAGFALVEVLVSGMILVTASVAVLGAVESATRSTTEERHRARAASLAEADLARMRAMRISDLSNLNQTRTVSQDGTPYTVASDATYQTDSTGTASCEAGTASADYIRIRSTVTWPSIGSRPPVQSASIVAPPNGSVSASSGSLAIAVEDSQNAGVPGVALAGTGTPGGSFSGVTDENGCAIFGNLPAGDYTVVLSGAATGLVDRDGNPPVAQQTSVVAESTNTLVLQYDDPGTIPVTFTTRPSPGAAPVASSADSVVLFNTGMTTPRVFGTPGAPASTITGTLLFPFASDHAVYAGTCEGDNPNPADDDPPPVPEGVASVLLPPGGSQPASIQLPALYLTAMDGTDAASPGNPVAGAVVTIADRNCPDEPTPGFKRTFVTNLQGTLADPGLPYSSYDVCVCNATQHKTVMDVSVKDMTDGTTLPSFYLGASVGTDGWEAGPCPS
jgi:Tfp pilus assembly protein PilV